MYSSYSEIKNILIVVAAGYGKRMQLSYPKQFLEYKGKPLFIRPVLIGNDSELIDLIIIVTQKENIQKIDTICKLNNVNKPYNVIPGGLERQESVYNGIKELENIENLAENAIIFVQDGVRPFFKEKYIKDSLDEINNNDVDGVVIGVPVKDTIKIIDSNGFIISTPERKTLIGANTPQVFKHKILKKAYEMARDTNFLGTDDSSLVEKIGGKVKIIIGDYDNIKITTPEDLKFI
ncbi:2-C-methyl-D-erythritol 4-phosphate cytidylyltransferase [Fusobacterium sp. PH5-44]|uniref:2-C-methyl-D-erythritol 4-phosphate cytidylyltransferase n=1 Tax=unclassified Fusobacterium TaxID=2648384 RepID=UPI003D225FDE